MHWNTNSSSVNCSLGRSQNKFQRCMEFQIRFTVGPISLSNWCKVYVVSVSLDNAKPLVNSQSLVNVCAVKTNYLVKSSLASYTSVFWASLVSTFYNLNGTLSLTTMTQQSRHADRSRQVIISFFFTLPSLCCFFNDLVQFLVRTWDFVSSGNSDAVTWVVAVEKLIGVLFLTT